MKKNPLKFHSVIILGIISIFIFSTTSCNLHIEKRRYRKGYYIDMSYRTPKEQTPPTYTKQTIEPENIEPIMGQSNKTLELRDSLTTEVIKVHVAKKTTVNKKKSNPLIKPVVKKSDHCDIITFTDGTQQEIIVEEISETEIKYKKCNFKEGPSYRISKSKVKKIDMYNGQVYIPTDTKRFSNKEINGIMIASLVLGILAMICVVIGGVMVFAMQLGLICSVVLAPAGILSLIGLIVGASQIRKGAHPLAWVAFVLNLLAQILAIIFTVMMFYI